MAYPALPPAPFSSAIASPGFFSVQSAALLYCMDQSGANDGSGRYKFGDIVEVVDDCPCNFPPAHPFFIVRVFGASRAMLAKYFEPYYDTTDPDNPVQLLRRLWSFDTTKMTPEQWDYMAANRYIELTVNQLRPYLLNKVTLVYEG